MSVKNLIKVKYLTAVFSAKQDHFLLELYCKLEASDIWSYSYFHYL